MSSAVETFIDVNFFMVRQVNWGGRKKMQTLGAVHGGY